MLFHTVSNDRRIVVLTHELTFISMLFDGSIVLLSRNWPRGERDGTIKEQGILVSSATPMSDLSQRDIELTHGGPSCS